MSQTEAEAQSMNLSDPVSNRDLLETGHDGEGGDQSGYFGIFSLVQEGDAFAHQERHDIYNAEGTDEGLEGAIAEDQAPVEAINRIVGGKFADNPSEDLSDVYNEISKLIDKADELELLRECFDVEQYEVATRIFAEVETQLPEGIKLSSTGDKARQEIDKVILHLLGDSSSSLYIKANMGRLSQGNLIRSVNRAIDEGKPALGVVINQILFNPSLESVTNQLSMHAVLKVITEFHQWSGPVSSSKSEEKKIFLDKPALKKLLFASVMNIRCNTQDTDLQARVLMKQLLRTPLIGDAESAQSRESKSMELLQEAKQKELEKEKLIEAAAKEYSKESLSSASVMDELIGEHLGDSPHSFDATDMRVLLALESISAILTPGIPVNLAGALDGPTCEGPTIMFLETGDNAYPSPNVLMILYCGMSEVPQSMASISVYLTSLGREVSLIPNNILERQELSKILKYMLFGSKISRRIFAPGLPESIRENIDKILTPSENLQVRILPMKHLFKHSVGLMLEGRNLRRADGSAKSYEDIASEYAEIEESPRFEVFSMLDNGSLSINGHVVGSLVLIQPSKEQSDNYELALDLNHGLCYGGAVSDLRCLRYTGQGFRDCNPLRLFVNLKNLHMVTNGKTVYTASIYSSDEQESEEDSLLGKILNSGIQRKVNLSLYSYFAVPERSGRSGVLVNKDILKEADIKTVSKVAIFEKWKKGKTMRVVRGKETSVRLPTSEMIDASIQACRLVKNSCQISPISKSPTTLLSRKQAFTPEFQALLVFIAREFSSSKQMSYIYESDDNLSFWMFVAWRVLQQGVSTQDRALLSLHNYLPKSGSFSYTMAKSNSATNPDIYVVVSTPDSRKVETSDEPSYEESEVFKIASNGTPLPVELLMKVFAWITSLYPSVRVANGTLILYLTSYPLASAGIAVNADGTVKQSRSKMSGSASDSVLTLIGKLVIAKYELQVNSDVTACGRYFMEGQRIGLSGADLKAYVLERLGVS